VTHDGKAGLVPPAPAPGEERGGGGVAHECKASLVTPAPDPGEERGGGRAALEASLSQENGMAWCQ